jgi:hypothetical protein
MPLFKLVNASDEVIDTKVFAVQPPNPAGKSWRWLPVVVAGDGAFDPATHKRTGPVTTIEETQVVDTYTIELLDAQEISDAKDAAVGALNGSLYAALAKAMLNHENRIRVLEAKAPITMAQFKTGVKALL